VFGVGLAAGCQLATATAWPRDAAGTSDGAASRPSPAARVICLLGSKRCVTTIDWNLQPDADKEHSLRAVVRDAEKVCRRKPLSFTYSILCIPDRQVVGKAVIRWVSRASLETIRDMRWDVMEGGCAQVIGCWLAVYFWLCRRVGIGLQYLSHCLVDTRQEIEQNNFRTFWADHNGEPGRRSRRWACWRIPQLSD